MPMQIAGVEAARHWILADAERSPERLQLDRTAAMPHALRQIRANRRWDAVSNR